MGEEHSFDENASVNLVTTLNDLRQQVYATYPADAVASVNELSVSMEALSERWWEVQEHIFTSTVPLIGPLIAGCRRLWHSISTKWAIRVILQQQNRVNYILMERLKMQSQILSELDQEQTRLTTQLAEISHQLATIESRLPALEQQE